MRCFAVLLFVTLAAPSLRAEPIHLRFATIAPEGTSWAREVKAFARNIEAGSGGRVAIHVYLGGIAGDDTEMGRRMRKDQLDGALSAGMLCQDIAPGYAVFRIPGLMQDRAESSYVMTRLFPMLREQAATHAMRLLTSGSLGSDVVLSRVPIESMEALRAVKVWVWDLDRTSVAFARAMGINVVPLPVAEAGRAYEEGRTDGFIAIPSAIFGFQWFARRLYMSQLPFAPLYGCAVMTSTAYERLPTDVRDVVENESVKFGLRISETTRAQDDELLGGLFAKQGIRSVPVSPLLRTQFLDAAHAARDKLGTQIVPTELLLKVQSFLADYRSMRR